MKGQCYMKIGVEKRKGMIFYCIKKEGHKGFHSIALDDHVILDMVRDLTLEQISDLVWKIPR